MTYDPTRELYAEFNPDFPTRVMPLLFGSASALVGVAGLFWVVGAGVGLGSRLAWRLGRGQADPRS